MVESFSNTPIDELKNGEAKISTFSKSNSMGAPLLFPLVFVETAFAHFE